MTTYEIGTREQWLKARLELLAADHAGAEIFLDPLNRRWRRSLEERGSELDVVVRSLIQLPLAWTNSPAEIIAAWPRTVIRSRCPRALTRRTQKPFSSLWKVTRSTRPAKTSVNGLAFGACGIRA